MIGVKSFLKGVIGPEGEIVKGKEELDMKWKIGVWGLLALSLVSVRGEEGIVTDRPDVVESADTVGFGRFQIETSVAQETEKDEFGMKSKTFSTPTLLRFGISEHLELRWEQDGWVKFTDEAGARETGFSDSSWGMKWHGADGDGGKPSVGVLAHVDVDSGHASFRGAGWRPSLRVVGEWELPRGFSAGVMPGVAYDTDSNRDRYLRWMGSAVLGKVWSDQFRTFGELTADQFAPERRGGNVLTAEAGAAWGLGARTQLDAALSWGLNDNAPDYSWTVGLSQKF